jgi:pimeloyl-ACP methyl ester carboxylesterase
MWDLQLAEFASKPNLYRLCLLDNRGSGESDIPHAVPGVPGFFLHPGPDCVNAAHYSVDTLARDAWTVADKVFGYTAKVHVIGHSLGSMIAQRWVCVVFSEFCLIESRSLYTIQVTLD